MHSYISNSDTQDFRAATWGIRVWLICALSICGVVEVGTRYGVAKINSNMRRYYNEYAAANRVGKITQTNQTSILFLGNSLTLTDIDFGTMQVELGSRTTAVRWAVDDTNYLDWLFGLRHIFRTGGRPNVVVVGGKSGHFLAAHVRGHFFAHYILAWPDLWSAVRRTNADANGMFDIMLAQVSAFYGSREEIYKRLVSCIVPQFPALAQTLNKSDEVVRPSPDLQMYADERLSELKALCAAHGASLVLWLPPTPWPDRNEKTILEAGRRMVVPIIVPIQEGQIPLNEYVDGFHLGAGGARLTTLALALKLKNVLEVLPSISAQQP